jgi:hypothetical protein
MTEQGLQTVIRKMTMDYLRVPGADGALEWALLGDGITALDESPNAQSEARNYINSLSTASVIRGYETSFAFTADMVSNNRVIMALYEVGRNQRTAAGAEKEYVRVEAFMPTGVEYTHPARLFRVAVEVSDISGEGTAIMEMSGTLHSAADFVAGVFNIQTKEFTALEDWTGGTLIDGLFLPGTAGAMAAAGFTYPKKPVTND